MRVHTSTNCLYIIAVDSMRFNVNLQCLSSLFTIQLFNSLVEETPERLLTNDMSENICRPLPFSLVSVDACLFIGFPFILNSTSIPSFLLVTSWSSLRDTSVDWQLGYVPFSWPMRERSLAMVLFPNVILFGTFT